MEILRGFIDHSVIASLALISSGSSRQNEILNGVWLFWQASEQDVSLRLALSKNTETLSQTKAKKNFKHKR